jgi:hypothetical protein
MKTIDKSLIPNFRDVVEFARWYLNAGMPTLLPENLEVFVSDDATASCLFRSGRYQFEIYLIHPNPVIPKHEHPGVLNIEISHENFSNLSESMLQSSVQQVGQAHGNDFKHRASYNGLILMSAQKWDEGIEMSTIGARWKGNTAGPKHEALIRRFNPDCLIYPGYADVTQKASAIEIY